MPGLLISPIALLCFTPDANPKNRLIDKDYMEREDGNQYRYVA